MPLIPEHVLDEIHTRADIAELIGRYVPLKRSGHHFKALCPFHKERTPSFHVNTDKQIFHCFGCGAGGNIFSFLMQQERLTFPEAVQQLAEQVGVTLAAEDQRSSDQRPQLHQVLEKACQYYQRLLAHPRDGASARRYLDSRGVDATSREAFRLGCAVGAENRLIRAAGQSGLPLGRLERAGLIVVGRSGPIDRFRQRLLFPIMDVRGRVVALGGRALADQTPKYLNSPETGIYTKGDQLFGLAQAKAAISQSKTAIVVEGYFDCVLLWQAGLRHTVSPLGTAFTPAQARTLARHAQRVILAFDPDPAGEQAALRSIELLLEHGLSVNIAQLPPGKDPDELARESCESFQAQLERSLGVVDFLVQCASRRHDLRDADDKVKAAQSALGVIAKAPDAMLRAEYVRMLAARLRIDESAMADELAKLRRDPAESRRGSAVRSFALQPSSPGRGAERALAALILDEPHRWNAVRTRIPLEQIVDERLRQILGLVDSLGDEQLAHTTSAQLISRLSAEKPNDDDGASTGQGEEGSLGRLISELVQLAQSMPSKEKVLQESIRRLHTEHQKRRLAELRQEIHRAQELGHEQELEQLLSGYQQLAKSTGIVPAGTEG
ncbi:MAG: DNA primase [Candidatus Omnitrophica bacterium]|nr:DNA primase [Candidatus Omnitrophota bacterium]